MASWVEFALLAAWLWTAIALLNKLLITHRTRNPYFATAAYGIGFLAFTSVVAFASHQQVFLPADAALMAVAAGMLSASALLFYFIALTREEVSRVMPVLSVTTIFVLLISYLALGERLSLQQYTGALTITAGAFLISMRRLESGIKLSSALYVILAAAILDAFRNVLTKAASQQGSALAVFFWLSAGYALFSLALVAWKWGELKKIGLRASAPFVAVSLLYTIATFANTAAISSGSVSLASALIETASLFTFLSAVVLSAFKPELLQEELSRSVLLQKIIAIALVIGGAFFIA